MTDQTATLCTSKDSWPRRLARPLVARMPSAVSPNHVTFVRMLIGLGACGLLTTGERDDAVWAAVMWLVAVFLDRVDGELARLTGTVSRFGQRLDYVADLALGSLFFVALGIGHGGSSGLWQGVVAGAAMLLIQVVAEMIDRDRESEGEKAFSGWAGFDPEDSHACFAPVVWLGWDAPFLAAASIGAPLFAMYALRRFVSLRRRRQREG